MAKHKQLTINDVLDIVQKTLDELDTIEQDQDIDESPTNIDFRPVGHPDNDIEEAMANEDVDVPEKATLIDKVITNFLAKCAAANDIPTESQTKSIYILDQINRSYQ